MTLRPDKIDQRLRARREHAGRSRYVDLRVGDLSGEAASQGRAPAPTGRLEPTRAEAWQRLPSEPVLPAPGESPTYYDRPVLKEPVWIWSVPVYFYVGGTSGAAAILAAAAHGIAGESVRTVVDRSRWIAAAGGGLGTALLIYDLGRPERFLHMLRVFRPTSPMNIGSWLLSGASVFTMGTAVLAEAPRPWRTLSDVSGYAAALFGMPLAAYPAALLSNTAVPVWQHARRSLPMLFAGSSIAGCASLLELTDLPPRDRRIARTFGVLGKAAELASMAAVEREAARTPRAARPLRRGASGALWRTAGLLGAASLGLTLAGRSRKAELAAGLLGTAAALTVRIAVLQAGRSSARDPRASFEPQRHGHGAAEVTRRAAVTGPAGQRATSSP